MKRENQIFFSSIYLPEYTPSTFIDPYDVWKNLISVRFRILIIIDCTYTYTIYYFFQLYIGTLVEQESDSNNTLFYSVLCIFECLSVILVSPIKLIDQ